jgi:hypothetical protein
MLNNHALQVIAASYGGRLQLRTRKAANYDTYKDIMI